MNNKTEVTTLAMGGALAVLFLMLFEPTLLEWRDGKALPLGVETALSVAFTVLVAWLLPAEVLSKIRRRTRPPKDQL